MGGGPVRPPTLHVAIDGTGTQVDVYGDHCDLL